MVEAVKAGEWTGTVDSFPALAGEVAMETVLRLTGKQALPLSAGKGDGLRAILLGQPGLRPAPATFGTKRTVMAMAIARARSTSARASRGGRRRPDGC